jgi:hypothetical protein
MYDIDEPQRTCKTKQDDAPKMYRILVWSKARIASTAKLDPNAHAAAHKRIHVEETSSASSVIKK